MSAQKDPPKCTETVCKDARCSGSDSDSGSFTMHHCSACHRLSVKDDCDVCQRCKCLLCQNCAYNLMIADSDPPSKCAEGDLETETFCYKCVINDPSMWCRDKDCDCAFKITTIFTNIVDADVGRDIVPGRKERRKRLLLQKYFKIAQSLKRKQPD